jgi:Flp pilus assembly pilin Flp
MIAVVTVREMLPTKPGGKAKAKFKTTSNHTFNCSEEELAGNFVAGERYKIDYNESTFQGSNGPVTMKWINRARFWKEEDGPNTWPDKEEYRGGGSSYSGGGKNVSKSDYDPEVGKRQTAANCATQFLARQEGMTTDEFALLFPVIADVVLKWVDTKGSLAVVADIGGAAPAGSDSDGDIPF